MIPYKFLDRHIVPLGVIVEFAKMKVPSLFDLHFAQIYKLFQLDFGPARTYMIILNQLAHGV